MGLTKEVRDFFVGRIHDVLNAKLATINSHINEKNVQKIALQKFCEKWDLPLDIIEQAEKLIKEEKRIDDEQTKLRQKIENAYNKAKSLTVRKDNRNDYNNYNSRYSFYGMGNAITSLKEYSFETFRDEVVGELYPEYLPQIKKIEHIKGEAQSAVMLATTEPKLVVKLASLLKKYGGDITELQELVSELE